MKKIILCICFMSLVLFLVSYCFIDFTHASLPTPTSTSVATTTPTANTAATAAATQTYFTDTTSGGDLSLPGGINISKPSSVKIGNINVAYSTFFDIAIGVSGTIFIVMLLVGGIQYLTAMGNDDVVTKSKKLLFDAVIGIIIVAVAWGVGTYVLSKLKIGSSTQGTTTLPQTIPTSTTVVPLPSGTIIETPEQFPGSNLPTPVMNIPEDKGIL